MAPEQQRPSRLDDPPTDSEEEDQEPSSQQRPSYEEEEEDDDDDEEGEEEEEEASSDEQEEDKDDDEEEHQPSRAAQPVSKTPPPQPANSHPKPSSSSESESESESESGSDPPASKVKPLASAKPSKDQAKTTSSKLKLNPKRPAEDNDGHLNDPKRAKKVPEDAVPSDNEDTKKSSRDDSKKLFQRLFSEEDDIAILEGMVEFSSKTRGKDPFKCAEEFHDFMKRSKSLSFDASSNQLKQKIRRLKKKFENNAGKGKKNGEGRSFSKPHEKEAFELSKKVWGGSGGEGNGAVEKPKPEKSTESAAKPKREANSEVKLALADSKEAGKTDEKPGTSLALTSMIMFDKVVGLCGMGEGFVRKRVELIEASKREELEGQWRKLQNAELELYVKRAELHAEQARLMLQANKSLKN